MPPALPGEFAFAASGQCLVTDRRNDAWFATGGGAEARVFRSDDRRPDLEVTTTPIPSGAERRHLRARVPRPQHGLAVGGDFLTPTVAPDALALTADGGRTWQLVADAPASTAPARPGSTGHDGDRGRARGSDVSFDAGQSWQRFDTGSFDTVDCANANACWASGEQGRAAHLVTD